MHCVYVLQNLDPEEEFYLGCSADLRRRVAEHNSGLNNSTAGRKWRLAYYEAYVNKRAAMRRETSLKKNRRMKSLLLSRVRGSLQ